jgi:hypothetical protein
LTNGGQAKLGDKKSRVRAAIVQYIADQVPEKNLAPANGGWERYKLQEWLNTIGTELHKGLSPLFTPDMPDEAKAIIKTRWMSAAFCIQRGPESVFEFQFAHLLFGDARYITFLVEAIQVPAAFTNPSLHDSQILCTFGISRTQLFVHIARLTFGFWRSAIVQAAHQRARIRVADQHQKIFIGI